MAFFAKGGRAPLDPAAQGSPPTARNQCLRPCLWTSEPMLAKLNALPKDDKLVITFNQDNGDRDQAWSDIAKAIEKIAKDG